VFAIYGEVVCYAASDLVFAADRFAAKVADRRLSLPKLQQWMRPNGALIFLPLKKGARQTASENGTSHVQKHSPYGRGGLLTTNEGNSGWPNPIWTSFVQSH
jgi:hypothetical protein